MMNGSPFWTVNIQVWVPTTTYNQYSAEVTTFALETFKPRICLDLFFNIIGLWYAHVRT